LTCRRIQRSRAAEQGDELASPCVEHGLPLLEPRWASLPQACHTSACPPCSGWRRWWLRWPRGGGFGGLGGSMRQPSVIHSITSSARASSVGGTLRRSVRAVSALINNSSLLD